MIYSTGGESVDVQGFVVGYDGGNCSPPNFAYKLVSPDHRTSIWLCADGSNEVALRRAMMDRGLYRVSGTLQQGEERPYVQVASVRWYYFWD